MASPAAYYNEIDPYAAQWLRNLIAAGHIAPGDVDERSIEDVHPDDVRGYTQAHWFAGIGVWSLALRRAGWPDDRPVWTGSCPCQPFSAAGKGTAFDDERHLWPHWHWLIQECRPTVIFGEQVASKDAEPWLDLVQADLEALEFAVAAVAFPAASIGAPHIRDRLYWMANAHGSPRGEGRPDIRGRLDRSHAQSRPGSGGRSMPDGLAFTAGAGLEGREQPGQRAGAQLATVERAGTASGVADTDHNGRTTASLDRCDHAEHHAQPCGEPGRLGNAFDQSRERDAGGISGAQASEHGARIGIDGNQPERPEHAGASVAGRLADALLQQRPHGQPGIGDEHDPSRRNEGATAPSGLRGDLRPGPVNGFWRSADWLLCRDGKWRPVEPGTFPLVDGNPGGMGRVRSDKERLAEIPPRKDQGSRVGRLRAYGNAINAAQAQIFIEEAMRCL
ncbi:DNA cytosine methyltransferase [Bordetella trematum]|uniref:DNA cytosine methyltransferase n=1 Tax=Bordetella trematum TaxID=123899 RepID=UPI003AF3FE9A